MRLRPDNRKEQILDAAVKVASRPGGWSKLTREAVAREAKCADALVSKYFGTMSTFRRTIMRAAIVQADLSVIAQGIAAGDKYAQKVDADLKSRALATLA
jgi:AcrR family transcriptional regulator